MGPLKKCINKAKYTLVKVTLATFLISVLTLPFFSHESPAGSMKDYKLGKFGTDSSPSQSDIDSNTAISGEEVTDAQREDIVHGDLTKNKAAFEKEIPYDVKIDDFTVTLPNKKAVIALVEKIKDRYDDSHEFKVSLQKQDGKLDQTVNIIKSDSENESETTIQSGQAINIEQKNEASQTELSKISFLQTVFVAPALSASQALDVDQAFDAVTKQKEQKTTYTVEPGDSLSVIAQKNNLSVQQILSLNEGLTENSLIKIGDSIVISVPIPELSVVTTKRMTYEEEYNAQIQYIQDDTMYTSDSVVVKDGTSGRRIVTADINYIDGKEQSRDYISEKVIEESQPQVIRVGTLVPPTYVKPLYGGKFTSGFEYRWGRLHAGVDWSVPQGTPVMASAEGTVILAGWNGSYGNCVEIRHSTGTVTRYAHLSKISVSVGQKVGQNQTIAYSGNTGDSTGPHLHFEIIVNGKAVNPLSYINK